MGLTWAQPMYKISYFRWTRNPSSTGHGGRSSLGLSRMRIP